MATKPKPPVKAQPQGGAVVPWQEKLAQEAAAGAASEVALSEFVSFRGGILTFNGQQIEGNSLDVIVLDSAYEHAFYGDYNAETGVAASWSYDGDNPKSPACYAFGRVETELAPLTEGEGVPEAPVHADCVTCPLNEWGSDPDGGRGKACKNIRRLALVDASVLQANSAEAIKAATTVFAKLPVTSGKNWSAFVIQIANVMKRPPYAVIARMTLTPDQRTQYQVKWEYVDNVPDELIPALMEKREKLGDAILFTYPPNEEREQQSSKPQKPVPQKHVAPPKKPVKK